MLDKTAKHLRQGTFLSTVKNEAKRRKLIYQRNLFNITRYGWSAPKFSETIWVYPHNCKMGLPFDVVKNMTGASNLRYASGVVIESLWPIDKVFWIIDQPKIKFCIDHWVHGMPWEDTGVYEYMEAEIKSRKKAIDSCKNLDDIVKRYKNLDLIFDQIKLEGRMRKIKEADPEKWWPGVEGVMHIGPYGKLFFGGWSWHRFAIAYILRLLYPAQIGCVHVTAIPYLAKYRSDLKSQNFQLLTT